MAKVMFTSLVSDVRNRVGTIVYSKWKKTHYVREHVPHNRSASAKQLEVRSAFILLVEIWKSMDGIMQESWENSAKRQNMTGYNSFLGRNSKNVRNNEALELFRELGEEQPLASLSASGGASGSIVCAFVMPADSAGRHVIFFSQKIDAGKETAEIKRHEADPNPASPFTITGLEPGVSYFIYAVVTDNTYANATTVSTALSVPATAGV